MNQLSASLKEMYANTGHEGDYIPVKGEVCVAKYTVDQAIKCFVADVIPAEGNWSCDCIKTIKSLLIEQYCSVKIVNIFKEEVVTFAVDVILPSSGKLLDHVLVEMGYGLVPKVQNSTKQSTDQSEPKDIGKMTAEDKIVVDRRDLIPKVLTLNVGDEFCGVVSHIQTPEDFFCQKLQSGHKLAELQASLSEYCGQMSPRSDFYPTIGDICCAQFSGVKPLLGIWTPEAICLMKKTVQNTMIMVKVVDKLENSSLVELVDKSMTPNINVTEVLIDAGFAVREKEIVTEKPSDKKEASVPLGVETKVNPLVWTWVALAVDQTEDVVVCMIYSPGEFYCHVLKEDALKKLNDLNKSLAELCQQKLSNDFKAEIGQPCCAFFAGDGNWYRALVKEIVPNGNIKVHFVDYGNIEEVTADELQMIPLEFLTLPFQGMQCWLVDIQPRNKQWTKEAIARFQMCVEGIKLQARVVEITENGVGLELTDLSTCYPRIISDVLIEEHLALQVRSPQKGLAKNRPVNNHDLQIDTPGHQAISSAQQWRTIELPVNKTVQASILEIINPNLFYALPNEMPEDQEKLCVLTTELLEYCSVQKSRSSYRPRAGDACCAKYTNDDFWYRAVVLGASEAEVKVIYADYGNVETLPLCRVQPISVSHLQLPFQIIKCSFEEKTNRMNCCCSELQKQVEKHEQILLFLLNSPTNQDKFIEMKKLLKS
ncbi:tudor domain-containing protein 1 [Molossus molossus]|uniref:tudor domain-containing protein 1 n=1 Tax=Molossus molossus TaxID=27622 RepID=UPI0017465D90|nr:tudor domain-containing protein 1 [Molossus molossus]